MQIHRSLLGTSAGGKLIDYKELPNLLQRLSSKNLLLITRRPPEALNNPNGKVIWISKVDHPNAIHPSRMHALEQTVWESLKGGETDGVILDALEYLMVEHGTEPVLKLVGKLRDMAVYNDKEFYVTVSNGLDDRFLALLKRIVE